jgi:ketosteroid isomerase-like protein
MIRRGSLAVIVGLAFLCFPACASKPDTATDEADITTTLETFYAAMREGDAQKAMSMIDEDAQFVESGRLETRQQYEENHLPNDIAFEKQVHGMRGPLRIRINGDAAWVIAETSFMGTFDGVDVDFVSSQLAVLTRQPEGWRIRSIHWSSRPRT